MQDVESSIHLSNILPSLFELHFSRYLGLSEALKQNRSMVNFGLYRISHLADDTNEHFQYQKTSQCIKYQDSWYICKTSYSQLGSAWFEFRPVTSSMTLIQLSVGFNNAIYLSLCCSEYNLIIFPSSK
jgi:hypothetical protein